MCIRDSAIPCEVIITATMLFRPLNRAPLEHVAGGQTAILDGCANKAPGSLGCPNHQHSAERCCFLRSKQKSAPVLLVNDPPQYMRQMARLNGKEFLFPGHVKINTLKLLNVSLILCEPDHNPVSLGPSDMESRILPKATKQFVISRVQVQA